MQAPSCPFPLPVYSLAKLSDLTLDLDGEPLVLLQVLGDLALDIRVSIRLRRDLDILPVRRRTQSLKLALQLGDCCVRVLPRLLSLEINAAKPVSSSEVKGDEHVSV